MPSIVDKLNLKQQQEMLVVNAPASFEPELRALKGVTVLRDPKQAKAVHFALAFTTRQAEADALSRILTNKAWAMRCCGLLVRKALPDAARGSSIATPGGARWGARVSIRRAR